MSISYNKLWKMLVDRNMNKTELRTQAKISTNAIAKMGKNEPVSMDTMDKICKVVFVNKKVLQKGSKKVSTFNTQ